MLRKYVETIYFLHIIKNFRKILTLGLSGMKKQAELLRQSESVRQSGNSKRKETKPWCQSGKRDKSDREKTSRKKKRIKIGLDCQVWNQGRRPRKVQGIEREDAISHQKTLLPAVVTHPLQRVGKVKMENLQKLKGFMLWHRKILTNMKINMEINSYLKKKLKNVFYKTIQSPITYKGLINWTVLCKILDIKIKKNNCSERIF